uniref:Transmembrane protein 231 n=1 Tax=Clastoptera arizonana TaxID=38151 RepID=A0A1B6CZK0_9HEMI
MVCYTVFTHNVIFKYKATLCSKATCILSVIIILTFLFPFLLSYNSHGFWLKTDSYKEQPDIHFKQDYLLILETNSQDLPFLCGTFPNLNKLSTIYGYCSLVKIFENDHNSDGLNDHLYFEVEVKMLGKNEVKSVTLLLLFDYKISDYCWVQMEGLGLAQHNSPLSGNRLDFIADLTMVQRQPLNPRLQNKLYNYSILAKNDEYLNLPSLLATYALRSVNTHLENTYAVWTSGRSEEDPFTIRASISYPEITVTYKPTFWQIIKFAWIQYFSILVISMYFFNLFKQFVFFNRLVHTKKENPCQI